MGEIKESSGGSGPIRITSPASREIWEQILTVDENAQIFQSPAWTDMLCVDGEWEDASQLYETPEDDRWVLPLVRRRVVFDRLAVQSSMPIGGALGGIISNSPLANEFIQTTLRHLREKPGLRTVIKPGPHTDPIWRAAQMPGVRASARSTHVLDLSGGFDRVWSQRFPSSTRTKLRKAEKSGVSIQVDTTGQLMPVFYQVYLEWVAHRARERHIPRPLARWIGRRREPLYMLQRLMEKIPGACQTWVAYSAGQPIAAAILFVYRCHAFYWRSASIKELAGPVRANDLLQLEMIRCACNAGCRYYHMGESGGVPSLMHFKSRFGAVERPYTVYSLESVPVTSILDQLVRVKMSLEQKLISK